MSVSSLARASRIDSEANNIAKRVTTLNSQLNSSISEVLNFAAFMHNDPKLEFSQEDRDKYSDEFSTALQALNTTISRVNMLAGIEAGTATVAEFLASYTGDSLEYSSKFDKG